MRKAPKGSQPTRFATIPKGLYTVHRRMPANMELESILETLVSQPCWNAIAGRGPDYTLSLDLGSKERRSLRLANPTMSFLQRTYEGSHSVLVECPWRIDGPTAVEATCFDLADDEDVAKRALDQLAKRKVVAATANAPGRDLVIEFEDGWALRTLAIEVDPKSERNNWQCWTPVGSITVGPRSRVVVATPKEAEEAFERLRLAPFEGFDDDVE